MIKNAAFISLSGYCWFVLLHYGIFSTFPRFAGGLILVAFLTFVPLYTGYRQNKRLLHAGPTILKILLTNVLLFSLFTGLLVWGSYSLQYSRLVPFHWQVGWAEAVFYSSCQLLFWLFGTLMAIRSAEKEPSLSQSGIIAISSASIPAVLILGSSGYPIDQLIFMVALWYLALSFMLSTRIKGSHHYGFTLFYCLVPCLLAFFLFVGFFSEEFRLFSLGLQNILIAIKAFLSRLANSLYSKLPDNDINDPAIWNTFKKIKLPVYNAADPNRSKYTLWIIVAASGLAVLWQFVKVLKIRLKPTKKGLPRIRFSWKDYLTEVISSIRSLWRGSVKIIVNGVVLLRRGITLAKLAITALIRNWLPPKTPEQAARRVYLRFLRWGFRRGVRRTASETPKEYAARLEKRFADRSFPIQDVRQLTDYYLLICYSNQSIDWRIVQECRSLLRTIKGTK